MSGSVRFAATWMSDDSSVVECRQSWSMWLGLRGTKPSGIEYGGQARISLADFSLKRARKIGMSAALMTAGTSQMDFQSWRLWALV